MNTEQINLSPQYHSIPILSPNSLSMHRCLLVEDILNIIFDYISPVHPLSLFSTNPHLWPQPEQQDLSSLANIALTCRALSEPALDRLWSELYGLCPLLRLFPEDAWERHAEAGYMRFANFTNEFVFLRELQEGDWTRFNHYAKKVRVQNISFPTSASRTPSAYLEPALRVLSRHGPTSGLLPQLHSLKWDCNALWEMHYFSLFVSPTITALDFTLRQVSITDGETCLRDFLPSIPASFPKLHTFGVTAIAEERFPPLLLPSFPITEQSFESLTALHIHAQLPSPSALETIGSMPRLETLAIDIPTFPTPSFTPESLCFSSLRELYLIATEGGRMAASFIDALRTVKLKALTIESCVGLTHTDTLLLCRSVSRFRALLTFALFEVAYGSRAHTSDAFSVEVFEPIFHLKTITALSIDVFKFAICDADLTTIASSFPALRVLSIACSSFNSSMTLHGMSALAEHCPHLSSLVLGYLDTEIEPIAPQSKTKAQNFSLSYFESESEIEGDPEYVASVLAAWFPRLRTVACRYLDVDDKWGRVQDLLMASPGSLGLSSPSCDADR
ncbi:hypothetical protein HGRIS_005506 [Hohenbuehelia grisea]|uniref:F-box domain-containing protein n=1 Tax=Hohenbuehelia grisea TaxID=104357 RepID=A0ABR3JZA2_9AGAR